MDDKRISELAERYGTPLYVYDKETIEAQFTALRQALPDAVEIFYSMKCNPLLGICQTMRALGSHIEVASLGELYMAAEAGFQPEQIIFTSPGKTRLELETAIDMRIASINVESVEEAELIDRLAAFRNRKVNIAMRINPNFTSSGVGLRMTGVPSQFGIDQDDADEAIRTIQQLAHVQLIGFHIFSGSQMLDARSVVDTMREIVCLSLALSAKYRIPMTFLDLGGGFGIPYFRGESPLDMAVLREGFMTIWQHYGSELKHVRVAVESGRFLMADSGLFVTKIHYVKDCKGSRYYVCDGGSHQHASSAFLGRYVRNNFPMRVVGKGDEQTMETHVVGSLCTPTDVIGQRVLLPAAEAGDLIVVEKSGAYGLTHSPVLFLSHVLPAEVIVDQSSCTVLRERGKVEDFLLGQRSLVAPAEAALHATHAEIV